MDQLHRVEKQFHAVAFDPSVFYRNRPHGMKQLLTQIGDVSGKTILDVGCGYGIYSAYFSLQGADVVALDISIETLFRLTSPGRAGAVHRVNAIAECLPFGDERFDILFGAAVLHHLDLRKAAKEFRRVLRAGGTAFFYEPLAYNPLINLYRRLTPDRRTPTEMPLTYSALAPFYEQFHSVEIRHYHLLALLPQIISLALGKRVYRKIQWTDDYLAVIDRALMRTPLKRYAQVLAIKAC
jgi:SAM-dependent methyltransferase